MRHASLALLLAVSSVSPGVFAGENDLEQVMTMRVAVDVAIAKDGSVLSHTIETPLPKAIHALVDKAVAGWTFVPPTVDGKAVSARGKMRISLSAKPAGERYAVTLENVVFPPEHNDSKGRSGGGLSRDVKRSPKPEFKFPAEAIVAVELRMDPTGRVVDVAATQCSLLAIGRDRDPATSCRRLEEASLRAARKVRVSRSPAEGADRKLDTATLAYHFKLPGESFEGPDGVWRSELRTAYRPAPWTAGSDRRIGSADLGSHALMQQSDRFHLDPGIIGQTLGLARQ